MRPSFHLPLYLLYTGLIRPAVRLLHVRPAVALFTVLVRFTVSHSITGALWARARCHWRILLSFRFRLFERSHNARMIHTAHAPTIGYRSTCYCQHTGERPVNLSLPVSALWQSPNDVLPGSAGTYCVMKRTNDTNGLTFAIVCAMLTFAPVRPCGRADNSILSRMLA